MSYLHRSLLVQLLDLGPRPVGLAQKLQAGLDAGVELEAAHVDALGEAFPAVMAVQGHQHGLEGHPVQGIVGL